MGVAARSVTLPRLEPSGAEAIEQMTVGEDGSCFCVGVFQDAAWASRGLDALTQVGFAAESLSIVAKPNPEAVRLIETTFGVGADDVEVDIQGLGRTLAHGTLVGTLQGGDDALGRTGVAATMRRAGFQAHDGFIFETLTARGGVLVAIDDEPRAADALAVMHAYGGGNAAIGAWRGRV